jgi:hypothetical protein
MKYKKVKGKKTSQGKGNLKLSSMNKHKKRNRGLYNGGK